ncbi:MAG: holo-ACP synthase [Peptococcaceae bacterium]|jgi:holo-[acyl-carrier protein] synthase|nr:holo-ACP synthase [Peptococcaceae bacterium]MDH7524731.1 holo-ACP synthase [Peptococcaceae bacterium]
MSNQAGLEKESPRCKIIMYVGTDIVEINRIRSIVKRYPGFYDRVLTGREKESGLGRRDPVPFLSGRFAAKEAVLKCIGLGISRLSFQDMEIIPDEAGAPHVFFSEKMKKILQERGIGSISVSISHSRYYATAVAIGECLDR